MEERVAAAPDAAVTTWGNAATSVALTAQATRVLIMTSHHLSLLFVSLVVALLVAIDVAGAAAAVLVVLVVLVLECAAAAESVATVEKGSIVVHGGVNGDGRVWRRLVVQLLLLLQLLLPAMLSVFVVLDQRIWAC